MSQTTPFIDRPKTDYDFMFIKLRVSATSLALARGYCFLVLWFQENPKYCSRLTRLQQVRCQLYNYFEQDLAVCLHFELATSLAAWGGAVTPMAGKFYQT